MWHKLRPKQVELSNLLLRKKGRERERERAMPMLVVNVFVNTLLQLTIWFADIVPDRQRHSTSPKTKPITFAHRDVNRSLRIVAFNGVSSQLGSVGETSHRSERITRTASQQRRTIHWKTMSSKECEHGLHGIAFNRDLCAHIKLPSTRKSCLLLYFFLFDRCGRRSFDRIISTDYQIWMDNTIDKNCNFFFKNIHINVILASQLQ